MLYKDEKTLVLIDGVSLYTTSKALSFEVDYSLLRKELAKKCRLVRMIYYALTFENDEYSPVRPLVDWLNYNGYIVRNKLAKEYTDINGRRKVKGNFGVELAIDAMEHARSVDHVMLFTGDGDFTALATSLQRYGVRVSVVSTLKTHHMMISDDLRRVADNFIELDDLRDLIGRAIKEHEV